nr:basic helix-loop-helix transcription factor [Loropetalum chinense var. rubrum]
MRTPATSNKHNSSSSSPAAAGNQQQQRKSTKRSTGQSSLILCPPSTSKLQSRQHATIEEPRSKRREQGSEEQQQDQDNVSELSVQASCAIDATPAGDYDYRKQTHCEIEKRRRDKMNHYIMELASVIPSFTNNQAKIDKLTVLRLAVQHVKSLRSSLCSFSSFHLRPSFLSSGNLLKNLILQMASQEAQDNLFMVVTCDRGKVLFVSESSRDILNHDQHELVGQCLFDILHKDDVSKVKEQISHYNLVPKEMLVDSKTLQPLKHNQRQSFGQLQNQFNSTPQPGARRSFFCRMKSGRSGIPANSRRKSSTPTEFSSSRALLSANGTSIAIATGSVENVNSERLQSQDEQLNNNCSQESTSRNKSSSTSSGARNDSENNINKSDANMARTKGDKNTNAGSINNDPNSRSKSINDSNIDNNSGSSPYDSGIAASDGSSGGSSSGSSSSSRRVSRGTQSHERSTEIGSSAHKDGRKNSSKPLSSTNGGVVPAKHLPYTVMHCTGYLKSILLRNDEIDDDDFDGYNSDNNSTGDEENDSCRTINCLVAVCRRSPMDRDLKPDKPLTFTCRYSMEGKFVFVDQRTTVALGYTPQQLLGTSHYAYCHKDSVNTFKECHRQCILKSEPVSSDIYQFKRANGQHLWLQTSLKSFRNPWTKFIDYIVANHTTAEGSDPHYNEGCVPTKFNQDMTEVASESSSPASSSSLSLPSMDSKKSCSPSSSSIGSSYSMDSYASGGSIQALLNQIDRIKTGGMKHNLDFHKRRKDGNIVRSGGSSARKSNEDSGNYSDPQSCSSLSSHNSAISTDYINLPAMSRFEDSNVQTNATVTILNNSATNPVYYGPKMNGMRPNLCGPPSYQAECQQHMETSVNEGFETNQCQVITNADQNSRMPGKVVRTVAGTGKQQLRHYGHHHQYHYKYHSKSGSTTSSDTGNESASWSNSSGSIYSNSPRQLGRQRQRPVDVPAEMVSNRAPGPMCNVPMQNVMRPDGAAPMNIVQMQGQMTAVGPPQVANEGYLSEMMPVVSYGNQEVGQSYNTVMGMNQMQQMTTSADLRDSNMDMAIQQHETQMSHRPPQQSSNAAPIEMPMIWNSGENIYQTEDMNAMHNAGAGQICAPGYDNQVTVPCPQCANQKNSSQQMMIGSNTDLNSINLSSLAVDGDLDEEQLLEYLAGCDPETQLYQIQSNAFPQYNIYR